MTMKNRENNNPFYIESSINPQKKEREIIFESEIGFSHQDFMVRIFDAMQEVGISIEELSISTYVATDKLRASLKGKQFLNFTERKAIGKFLGF